jgi:hypothetical protein
MKKSELKNLIKEEIKSILNEEVIDKIYHLEGTLITSPDRNIQSILSDIRSIPGITIVKNSEAVASSASKFFRADIDIKIDPFPYTQKNKSNPDLILKNITAQIKRVNGVVGFNQTDEPYSSNL